MLSPVVIGHGVGGASVGTLVRSACRPMNLVIGGLVVIAWGALIAWTGAGSRGWQARLCADLAARPQVCAAVQAAGPDARPAGTGAAS